MEKKFFGLLQVSLGLQESLDKNPSEIEWSELFVIAQKQAIEGIVFDALDCLSKKNVKPPISLLYEWIGQTETSKQGITMIE